MADNLKVANSIVYSIIENVGGDFTRAPYPANWNGFLDLLRDMKEALVNGGGSVSSGTTPPSSPVDGQLWWDTRQGRLMIYNDGDGEWYQTNGADSLVHVSDSKPGLDRIGQAWFDSRQGKMFGYIPQGFGNPELGYYQTNGVEEFVTPPNELLTDLFAYWKFDETSGTRVDAHTNGYDFAVNGTVGSTTGFFNNAPTGFTSANYLLNTADNTAFGNLNGGDWTMSFWEYRTAIPSSLGSSRETILGRYTGSGTREWWLYVWDTGYNFAMGTGTGSFDTRGPVISNADILLNQWAHVVLVHDSTAGTVTGFYNGDAKIVLNYIGTAATNQANRTTIGTFQAATSLTLRNGDVDEFAIWSRALSSDDILNLFNSGTGLEYDEFD